MRDLLKLLESIENETVTEMSDLEEQTFNGEEFFEYLSLIHI